MCRALTLALAIMLINWSSWWRQEIQVWENIHHSSSFHSRSCSYTQAWTLTMKRRSAISWQMRSWRNTSWEFLAKDVCVLLLLMSSQFIENPIKLYWETVVGIFPFWGYLSVSICKICQTDLQSEGTKLVHMLVLYTFLFVPQWFAQIPQMYLHHYKHQKSKESPTTCCGRLHGARMEPARTHAELFLASLIMMAFPSLFSWTLSKCNAVVESHVWKIIKSFGQFCKCAVGLPTSWRTTLTFAWGGMGWSRTKIGLNRTNFFGPSGENMIQTITSTRVASRWDIACLILLMGTKVKPPERLLSWSRAFSSQLAGKGWTTLPIQGLSVCTQQVLN